MEIVDCIEEQMTASKLPLVGVTLAAVPCPDTPVILTLHWHGFFKERLIESEDANPVALKPVPSTALQLNARWRDLLDVDLAAMEAGWELGAWDVVRAERPACIRPGAEAKEALDCLQAFGAPPAKLSGADLVVAEAPDVDALLGLAARSGYLCWQFRPVHGGIWSEVSDDATLDAAGKRPPPCPLEPVRPHCDGRRRTVYRFGAYASPTLLT